MTPEDKSEIIRLAWCDKTSFDEIALQYGLSESEVIKLMRSSLKRSSFRLWRKRVSGRAAKHTSKRQSEPHSFNRLRLDLDNG